MKPSYSVPVYNIPANAYRPPINPATTPILPGCTAYASLGFDVSLGAAGILAVGLLLPVVEEPVEVEFPGPANPL